MRPVPSGLRRSTSRCCAARTNGNTARPGFAFERDNGGAAFNRKGLTGRSARVIVTMGMPAIVYRWYFRAHSVKSLERNILGFIGISPVHETLIGMVGALQPADAARWLTKLERLGRDGG